MMAFDVTLLWSSVQFDGIHWEQAKPTWQMLHTENQYLQSVENTWKEYITTLTKIKGIWNIFKLMN